MPQDGSNNYYYPPGTPGVPDQTIESEAYNTFLNDLVNNDLNIPRPVHRGGTGAVAADQGLSNLTGEKAAQLVTNFDSHVWLPGSFRSTNTVGQAAPVDGHAFAGICYLNEPFVYPPTNQNLIVEARDENDTVIPGRVYVRQKKAGVWDAAWVEQVGGSADLLALADARYVDVAGDAMTGLLTLSGDPTADMHSATKRYVDGGVGGLSSGKVDRDGDTMTGPLVLPGNATLPLEAVPKQQLDVVAVDALAYSGIQINGSMEVDQPNAGASVAVAAGTVAHANSVDGWYVAKTGTNAFSVQQATSVFSGYTKELKLTIATAQASIGSDTVDIRQAIEGHRTSRLAWGAASAAPLTIGFWVKSSVSGVLMVVASNSTLAVNATATVTIASAAVAQFVTATFAAQTTGTWLADNGIGIIISVRVAGAGSINIAATNGNTFEMTGLIILPGIIAPTAAQSPLVMRPYDQELLTCKRYWQALRLQFTAATSYVGAIQQWPVELRASPTISWKDDANNNTGYTISATHGHTAIIGTPSSNPKHVAIDAILTSSVSNGWWATNVTADARL